MTEVPGCPKSDITTLQDSTLNQLVEPSARVSMKVNKADIVGMVHDEAIKMVRQQINNLRDKCSNVEVQIKDLQDKLDKERKQRALKLAQKILSSSNKRNFIITDSSRRQDYNYDPRRQDCEEFVGEYHAKFSVNDEPEYDSVECTFVAIQARGKISNHPKLKALIETRDEILKEINSLEVKLREQCSVNAIKSEFTRTLLGSTTAGQEVDAAMAAAAVKIVNKILGKK